MKRDSVAPMTEMLMMIPTVILGDGTLRDGLEKFCRQQSQGASKTFSAVH
jgi:hypothetical protein